jgi:hypothetical protein
MQATVDDDVHAVVWQETELTTALAVRVLKPKFSPEIVMLADCPPHQGEFRNNADDPKGAAEPGRRVLARASVRASRTVEGANRRMKTRTTPYSPRQTCRAAAAAPSAAQRSGRQARE